MKQTLIKILVVVQTLSCCIFPTYAVVTDSGAGNISTKVTENAIMPKYFEDQVEIRRHIGNGVQAYVIATVWTGDGSTYKFRSIDEIGLLPNDTYAYVRGTYRISSDSTFCEITFVIRNVETGREETRVRTIDANGEAARMFQPSN